MTIAAHTLPPEESFLRAKVRVQRATARSFWVTFAWVWILTATTMPKSGALSLAVGAVLSVALTWWRKRNHGAVGATTSEAGVKTVERLGASSLFVIQATTFAYLVWSFLR